jgi:hypothetical protein
MRKRGDLFLEEREVQKACGTLEPNQNIFQVMDTARIFQIWSRAYSMPLEGLEHIPAAEDAEKFRKLIGRPYNLAKTTAEIEKMVERSVVPGDRRGSSDFHISDREIGPGAFGGD